MSNDSALSDKKIELIQWLSTIEDATLLNKIMNLRKEEDSDWWNSISDPERKSIEKGIKDADEGKLKDHTKARQLYEKWL